jgi:hypothetical protein
VHLQACAQLPLQVAAFSGCRAADNSHDRRARVYGRDIDAARAGAADGHQLVARALDARLP